MPRKKKRQLEDIKAIQIDAACVEWCDIDAAADGEAPKLPRVKIKAYTGGPMRVAGFFRPVVVDLAGMKVSGKTIPVIRDHDFSRIVGHTDSVAISATDVDVDGIVSAENEHASEVIKAGKNGFPWQASVGASVNGIEVIREGQKATVNGKSIKGPVLIARKTVLNEVSIVPLGADRKTSTKVAASAAPDRFTEDEMNFQQWLEAKGFDGESLSPEALSTLKAAYQAEVKAEADKEAKKVEADSKVADDEIKAQRHRDADESRRKAAIRDICAEYKNPKTEVDGEQVDLEAHAIEKGWSAKETKLEAMLAARPKSPAIHVSDEPKVDAKVVEAAICQTNNLEDTEKKFTDQQLQAAHDTYRGRIGLQQLLLTAAWIGGYAGRHFDKSATGIKDILQAAFSTVSLPGILGNTANKFILEAYSHVEQAWRDIAAIRSVSDFKTATSYRLTGNMDFEKVGPGGELKHGTLGEASFTNKADTYGKMFSITRQDIINDDLGALSAVPRMIGRGSALKLNDVLWTAFLDNSAFFASGNNNYIDGASTNLQSSSLEQAVEKFRKQTDPNGKPIAVMPRILLVPPEEEVTADELFVSTHNNTGGSSTKNKVPNRNTFAGKYRPVVSSYLSNSSYTGYSALAWYLLADPRDVATIEVAFLNGQQSPVVESAEAGFNVLGIQVRGYFDFGVSKHDHRGGVKSKGEA